MATQPLLPINPGASRESKPPPSIIWLSQEADINLLNQPTNCYVIDGPDGAWVVDPPSAKPHAIQAIMEAAGGKVAGIWVTHSHPDHIGGLHVLRAQTGAPIYAHERATSTILVDEILQEGQRLDEWMIYYLPGHRYDSVAFVHALGYAIAGDLVAGAGSVIIDPSDGDLVDYVASLYRLRDEIEPTLILPGHGPLCPEPYTIISHFITHRMQREAMVLASLRDQPQPLATLLPFAYSDTPAAFYPLAERALLAHLYKLEREGRVQQQGGNWRLL